VIENLQQCFQRIQRLRVLEKWRIVKGKDQLFHHAIAKFQPPAVMKRPVAGI
jgi:hypothetical protein